MKLLIFVTLLLPLLYLFIITTPINLRSRNNFFFLNEEKSGYKNIFGIKTMKVFVYSYKEREWLKNSLAVAVKTYVSKAEIQLFLNSYSFYFYMPEISKI